MRITRRRQSSPVVFCGSGNRVCDRKAVARAIREQARVSAVSGHLAWR